MCTIDSPKPEMSQLCPHHRGSVPSIHRSLQCMSVTLCNNVHTPYPDHQSSPWPTCPCPPPAPPPPIPWLPHSRLLKADLTPQIQPHHGRLSSPCPLGVCSNATYSERSFLTTTLKSPPLSSVHYLGVFDWQSLSPSELNLLTYQLLPLKSFLILVIPIITSI
jgi:hypothetical protein